MEGGEREREGGKEGWWGERGRRSEGREGGRGDRERMRSKYDRREREGEIE